MPRADRILMLEFACEEPGCLFKLYFGKKKSTFNFVLECAEFQAHSHELLINKEESKLALEKLDFAPIDNKFSIPMTWDNFVLTSKEQHEVL